jgi:hypothetical protein
MEQLKVLAAALALQNFTVEEISGLSGVNIKTVRSVLQRNPELVRRADKRDDTASLRRGRGRPARRWVVVDSKETRRLVGEIGALPRFEPSYPSMDTEDRRSVAVAVAENALTQLSDEPDAMLRERLLSSARSSLFFAEKGGSQSSGVPWWQTEDSPFAVRARGVDSLAMLASQETTTVSALTSTAQDVAAAMLVSPDRPEATYFVPLSQILAQSGHFAPMFALSGSSDESLYEFADDWAEIETPRFRVGTGHLLTQAWAKALVNVSVSMPVVISAMKFDSEVDQMIDGIKVMPRPALIFGPPGAGHLIRNSGRVGATFVPVEKSLDSSRQYAIESVAALIDRFSIGR